MYAHDFMRERNWVIFIEGYSESRSIGYILYIVWIFCFMGFLLSMCAYAAFIAPNKDLAIDSLHVMVIGLFGLWCLVTRLVAQKSLYRAINTIRNGFYEYPEEDLDPEQVQMKEKVVEEVRKRSSQFIFVFMTGAVSNIFFFPISQYLLVTDEQYEQLIQLLNPYLPLYFYLPFSTRTTVGFSLAFLLNVLAMTYTYGMAIVTNEIFISTVIQMKVQLKILNYSIRNIYKRALKMYNRQTNRNVNFNPEYKELYKDKQFQRCLYLCLRSNIRHHQMLLRFKDEFLPFNGACLLSVVLMASIIFASLLFHIMKNPPLNIMLNLVISLLSEQTYSMFICYFGEQIMEESGNLFESLYSIEWWYCDKDFHKLHHIFMVHTRKPIRINALLLAITASLENYANFISAMYKIMNLLS